MRRRVSKTKYRSAAAKALQHFPQRVVRPRKGRGSYKRNGRTQYT